MSADGWSAQGSSVLVAGATGGIGSAVCAELAARGATLTLVARDAERLDALDVDGARAALDLRHPEDCAAAVQAAVEHGGRLDAVVNAIGVIAFGTVDELSVDVLEELFLTNTFAPIFLTKAALPAVSEDGVIVNLSAVVAEHNLPGMAAYGASKAALRSFDEALTGEVRRRKLRVLDVRPPHTDTGLDRRPIAGTAPRLPQGLAPAHVATVICDAMEQRLDDLPSSAFES